MKKDFKEIAAEMKAALRRAITMGLMSSIDDRLDALLDEFEAKILAFADDEAAKRARTYLDELKKDDD